MDSHFFLKYALTYLGVAVVAVPIFRWLGLGAVLGYLAAGGLIGPWGARIINDPQRILGFAELGVVFLLFIIGLELNPRRLWVMRRSVFGLGGTQVLISGAFLSLAAWAWGVAPVPAVVIGSSLALSSTAFALQIMGERGHLNSAFGRASFGILLFQDLAAIPLIAIVPFLATKGTGNGGDPFIDVLEIFGVIAGLVVGGRYVLQPLLRIIAKVKMREIFTSAALLLVLGVALLMESIGVSMALGAFLSGLLLADSEHRHELEADIEPFKGLLLGLFFISIGMSVDYGLFAQKPWPVLSAVVTLLTVKALVLFAIGKRSGLSSADSVSMALTIPQGGEFGFVIFGVAVTSGVLDQGASSFLVLVVTMSMALTPLLVVLNDKVLQRRLSSAKKPFDEIKNEANEVIIAGFGRFGQIVGRILRVRKIGFTALEHDQAQVDVLRKFGNKVYYGDASRLELLEAAGAKNAKYFVLAIDDLEASIKTAKIVKQHFPHLKIFARARNRQHAYELLDLGIATIHRETLASSLEMTREVLIDLGFDEDDADRTVRKFRQHDEEMLSQQFRVRHDEKELINYSKQYSRQLAELFEADRR